MMIQFEATNKFHDSGYRILKKTGDLQFDIDKHSFDGIWLELKKTGEMITIDCNSDGVFSIKFGKNDFKKQK